MNETAFILVGLRDKVSGRFESVTLDYNEHTAKRNFAFAVNNSNELLFKSKDIELYKLACFDTLNGKLDIVSPYERICSGDEVIQHE